MKRCLFLRASASACGAEVTTIRQMLSNLGISMVEIEWLSHEDFCAQMKDQDKFDVVYLGAHADGHGFGETQDFPDHPWEELSGAICSSDCMLPNGFLFLGCCRGGMKTVALKILQHCDKIDYICGPNWKTDGGKLTTAFQTFLQNLIKDKNEPAVAAKRASDATGRTFSCYDRQELEAEIEMLRKIGDIESSVSHLIRGQGQILDKLDGLNGKLAPPPMNSGDPPSQDQPKPT